MNPSKLLTSAQVAERTGIAQRTIQLHALRGKIPCERVTDRLYLFDPSVVKKLTRKPPGRPAKH